VTVTSSRPQLAAMRDSLRGYVVEARPYQRFLYRVAALFAVSAVLHAVVFLADDRPWDGRGSWRQPLAFSLAFALILPSLAWVMDFLPRRRTLGWAVSGTLGAAALGTVFLIALQTWRDQAAFFPEDLPFDQGVWTGLQIGIGLIVLAIVVETVWAMTRVEAPSSFRWAMKAGLVLVVTGLGMGGLMIAEGLSQEELGPVDSPVTFGEAGLVIFPHLLSLHGVLVLAVLAWFLSFTPWPERRRTRVVQVGLAAYVVLIAVSLAEALAGRAPFEPVGAAALFFWTSLALFVAAFAATLIELWRTPHRPLA
jgi:hypothetical protein